MCCGTQPNNECAECQWVSQLTLRTDKTPVPEGRIRRSVFRVLTANNLCSIATLSRGNQAHINTAFFAYSPLLELYFLSDPESLHCRNLAANPAMAMTIFDSRQRWEDPGKGIQLFGTAHQARGPRSRRAEAVYGARFPAFARWLQGKSQTERRQAARLRSYVFFGFLPKRVKILDEAEFGGARFVIAAVRRRHTGSRQHRAELEWQTTEVLVPSETERATP